MATTQISLRVDAEDQARLKRLRSLLTPHGGYIGSAEAIRVAIRIATEELEKRAGVLPCGSTQTEKDGGCSSATPALHAGVHVTATAG